MCAHNRFANMCALTSYQSNNCQTSGDYYQHWRKGQEHHHGLRTCAQTTGWIACVHTERFGGMCALTKPYRWIHHKIMNRRRMQADCCTFRMLECVTPFGNVITNKYSLRMLVEVGIICFLVVSVFQRCPPIKTDSTIWAPSLESSCNWCSHAAGTWCVHVMFKATVVANLHDSTQFLWRRSSDGVVRIKILLFWSYDFCVLLKEYELPETRNPIGRRP